MTIATAGIHHISSIAGDAQRNLSFYSGVLGLRLVKVTVNFDDPGSYHFYYGDQTGQPGTLLTFFPWGRKAAGGRVGTGQAAAIALSIAPAAMAFWIGRLIEKGIPFEGPRGRLGNQVLSFKDPDGNPLELVGHATALVRPGREIDAIPADASIRGIHGVTLLVSDLDATARVLTEVLGLVPKETGDSRYRFESAGELASIVDVRVVTGFWSAAMGVGSIHHVAFRSADPESQSATRARAMAAGLEATAVQDRHYFQSVYFREPGGVLFESATEEPGFLVDESADQLGHSIQLPPWLEPQRAAVEGRLPPLVLPHQDSFPS